MVFARRRLTHLILPLVIAVGALAPSVAGAAEWVEPRFDPPVGSQWAIERELNVQQTDRGALHSYTLRLSARLTIDAKTDDGFRVTYTRQSSSSEGDPSFAPSQLAADSALQGVAIHIVTDAAGKPLRIENFAEVKTALSRAIEALPTSGASPQAAAAVRRLAERLLTVDERRAAEIYLDQLPLLAVAQNTGLKPGERRDSDLPVANPFGGAITKTLTLSIEAANPATGKVRYLMTEAYDPEAIKSLVADSLKELGPTPVSAAAQQQVAGLSDVSMTARAQFDVAAGMTRELRRQSLIKMTLSGAAMVKTEDELLTVKPVK